MSKHLITTLLILSISAWTNAQSSLDWIKLLGGSGEDYANKIVTDQQGNVYGIGHFRDSLEQLYSFGSSDVIVFKYDASGNLQWLTQLGGSGEDLGNDIAINNNGQLFITGHYRDTFYYQNDSLISLGNTDAFLALLNTQGTIQWVKSIGLSGFETGNAVACDPMGNSYIAGTFEDTLAVNNQPLQAYGTLNNFLLKLDPLGNLIWDKTFSTPTFNNFQDIKLDASGNVYIIGHFRDLLIGSSGQLPSNGNNDVFLLKISSTGQFLWWKNMGGTFLDFGFALHLHPPYLYITGVHQDTAFFDNQIKISEGEFDAFLAQYTLQGTPNWVQHIGGIDDSKAFDLATTPNGNIHLVGYFEGTAIWGSDSVSSRSPRHVPSDVFIAEYNSIGNLIAVNTFQGPLTDYATGISIVDSSCIYIAGVCQDSIDFDSTLMISQGNSSDIFLLKYQINNWTNISSIDNKWINCQLFPNPMQKTALFTIEFNQTTKVRAVLYNNLGQPLNVLLDDLQCKKKQITIHKNQLSPGIYYINIQTANRRQQLPIIIH